MSAEAAPRAPNHLEVEDIDISGDVLATIYTTDESDNETEIAVLRVSSHILSLASLVFKAMLDPKHGFRESQANANNTKEIRLAADSKLAAHHAMKFIHFKTEGLQDLNLDDLYHLATFCDCYQLRQALRFTACAWTMTIWTRRKRCKKGGNITKWLWIGITFYVRDIIKVCGERALNRMTLQQKKEFLLDGAQFHSAMEGVLQIIWSHRESLLKEHHDAARSASHAWQELLIKDTKLQNSDISEPFVSAFGICKLYKITFSPKGNRDELPLYKLYDFAQRSSQNAVSRLFDDLQELYGLDDNTKTQLEEKYTSLTKRAAATVVLPDGVIDQLMSSNTHQQTK